ncbi:MAG: two-component sensor histidine kinase [Xanthobacteraceae bacterium]|nr:MAG: two-component sensor histidine kinase [Xanthobacteraceae bacterium]
MAHTARNPSAGLLERLARAAIILLVTAMALIALAVNGALAPGYALITFLFIVGAALVPWQMHRPVVANPLRSGDIIENAIVNAIVGGYPEPTVLLDRAGRVLAFNRLAADLAPVLRRGEPAQLALRTPEIIAALHRAMTTGEAQRTEYYERVPIENWMLVAVTPFVVVTDPGGKDRYLLMTFHDQTPLRRVEEMRADFVANASHELRTPLAALSGFIDTLQGPARNDAAARERFLAIMAAQAARMARLIDDLLSLSRIELNAHVRPEAPVDLVTIVRQVVEGLELLARERQVTVAVDVPAAPIMVPGDRDELLRVVENLIENALKYGASGGRVEIALAGAGAGEPEARISVRDFGPGIAPEHLHRLTERFYRVDVGESRAQGGTGLGLSLVKHILNRHRGRLAIESTPGAGATFTVFLPAASV